MLVNNWKKTQELFFAAADLPAAERHRYLDTSCAGDPGLRREVELLLAADRTEGPDLAAAVATAAQELLQADPILGTRLGSWRVVREIGRGGMGVVYEAVRDDAQYDVNAALKLVKRGMDTVDLLGRLRHERQILANLNHPNIARLIDGGTTLDGRPFLVMEYVDGKHIDTWCRDAGLSVEDRCRLMLKVCEAVSSAHRNLIVHRDLKPGNILVTLDGEPKLLDFGVAKLLAPGLDPAITFIAGERLMTPDYASPEQFLGQPITTSTDVYSLGAVLYELLTGAKAHRLTTNTPADLERIICQTEVRRPSEAVNLAAPDAARIKRRLAGDLDNILLMALRKDPARRYASVDQMADDLHRFLDGRAVLARHDSFGYRARKFARRRRWEMAATALVTLSLVAGLAVALSQRQQAETARNQAEAQRMRAERERARAEAARVSEAAQHRIADQQRDQALLDRHDAEERLTELLDLANRALFDVNDAIALVPGTVDARRRIVSSTLGYLEGLEKSHGLDGRMRLALSAAYYKLGGIQGDPVGPSLQDSPGAERSYRKAESILAPLMARGKDDPDGMLLWLMVEASLADLANRTNHSADSVAMYERLLPIAHRLRQLRPNHEASARQEASLHQDLARSLRDLSRTKESLLHANQALALGNELLKEFPASMDLKRELGSAYSSAAAVTTDLSEAGGYYQQSIRMREAVLRESPHDVSLRRALLVVYGNYAGLLGLPYRSNLGRPKEAESYCRKSVALARELVDADPKNMTAQYDLGVALCHLGASQGEPNQAGESLATLEEAAALIERVARANPKSSSMAVQLAMAQEYQGRRLDALKRSTEAEGHYGRSLATLEPFADPRTGALSCILQAVESEEEQALHYARAGDGAIALKFANRAVARAAAFSAADPKSDSRKGSFAKASSVLAMVSRQFGDRETARQSAERAVTLWHAISDKTILDYHHAAREQSEALLRGEEGNRR